MIFGVAKEIKDHETRVGLLPSDAKELIDLGSKVIVETGAGALCGHPDEEYVAVGAEIVPTMADVYNKSDMVLAIKELEDEHMALLRDGLILATSLHSNAHPAEVDALLKNKVTAIAYEDITDAKGEFPILKTQSPVAGAGAVIMAAYFMSAAAGGPGIMLSKITGCPVANVTVTGAGFAGIAAAQTAAGMGANVTLMDINVDRLNAARAVLPDNVEFLLSTKANIEARLEVSDLLLNCVPWPKHRKDYLITREMMQKHAKKTLYVADVACDVDGALETCIKSTSHSEPLYELDGITYYTVDNIPAAFGRTVCQSFTQPMLPFLKEIATKGVVQALKDNKYLRTGLTTYNGLLTLKETGLKQNRPFVSPEEALGM
jgi:alanine dehydrogenase